MKTSTRRAAFASTFLCLLAAYGFAQNGSLLVAKAGIDSAFEPEPRLFMPGYYLDTRMYFPFAPLKGIDVGIGLSYTLLPTQGDDSLSLLETGGIISRAFPLSRRMDLRIDGVGGLNAGILNNVLSGKYETGSETPWGISGFLGGDATLNWYLKPDISITASAGYKYVPGLYNGLRAGIGVSFCVPATDASLRITGIKAAPVLPAFRNYYLENPAVRIDLENDERFTAENLSIRVAAGPLNEEGEWIHIAPLEPGRSVSAYLPVKWSEKILSRTETAPESIQLEITYTAAGTRRKLSRSDICVVTGHNNFIWQVKEPDATDADGKIDRVLLAPDGKAAVFVDPNDSNLVSLVQEIQHASKLALGFDALPRQLESIIGVAGYLQSRLIHYQVDPNSIPYGTGEGRRVDFLRYPSETLRDGYGDCDDLSILTAALLEACGVRTAFITVPGHIFIAAETGLDPRQAEGLFGPDNALISRGGSIWMPIEVTAMDKGLDTCRQLAFDEWNSSLPDNRAFYPLDEAWSSFKPSQTAWALSQGASRPGDSFAPTVVAARKDLASRVMALKRSSDKAYLESASDTQKGKFFSGMAFLEYSFGELDSAYADIQEAVRLNPGYSSYYNAGLIASLLGKKSEAAAFLGHAVALRDSAQARTLLASIQENGGDLSSMAAVATSASTGGEVRSGEASATMTWEADE